MSNELCVQVEELREYIPKMRVGDRVKLSGVIHTARDAAHREIFRLLDNGGASPFEIKGAVIYYAGPTPGGGTRPTGSCGPTTASRMDAFAPRLYDLGLAATIGKGERSALVKDAVTRNRAAYLCAVGGAGALIARHIVNMEEVAFPDLGCESVKRLTVENMPLIVGLDIYGGDIFSR